VTLNISKDTPQPVVKESPEAAGNKEAGAMAKSDRSVNLCQSLPNLLSEPMFGKDPYQILFDELPF
jgi:hypothetical protein